MKLPSLSICIPAYNDQETIADVVAQASRVGPQAAQQYEILVINDASTDDTGQILAKLKKKTKFLTIINHGENQGYGGTIRELYETARMEWLFTVPGDNQIPVAEVTKLMPRTEEAEMIIGQRTNRQDPPERLRQSKIYNQLLEIMFGVKVHDVNSVRLMKTAIVKSVKLTTRSAFVDAELVIKAQKAGFRVIEEPIVHSARAGEGASGGKLSTILPVIEDLMKFRLQII